MAYFEYSKIQTDYLKQKDHLLGTAINEIGHIQREVNPDLFQGLMKSMIEQQISMKAAQTIWLRFASLAGEVTPQNVANLDAEQIQKQGMTMRKAITMKIIAEKIQDGAFDLNGLAQLSDREVVKKLVSLPGIGVWTAEMLMIFSLQRQDIVSWQDFGIRRGMMQLYHLSALDKKTYEKYRQRYSPYGSVASLYLWDISTRYKT